MGHTLNRRGALITFEGIDGSGKTTQVTRLCARLEAKGVPHIRTREPGGTPLGDAVREILLSPSSIMSAATEAYLYAAARAEHVRAVMRPALATGVIVVCDRYLDASVAYQGYGLEEPELLPETVRSLNELAVAGTWPDLTIMLDVDPEVAQKRLQAQMREPYGGADRIERRGREFFERVRDGLRRIATDAPTRCLWLDGNRDPEFLEREIWMRMTPFF